MFVATQYGSIHWFENMPDATEFYILWIFANG